MTTQLRALLTLSLLVLSSEVLAVESLGRLFTTPEERANLDYLRQTTKAEVLKESTEASTDAIVPVAPAIPSSVSMQGYVKRSDGKKGTVWVNNHPMQEDTANGDIEVGKLGRDGNQVQLKLPANGKNFNLKAGQSYSSESDSVTESSRATTVKPVKESGTIGEPLNNQPLTNPPDKPAP